MASVRAGSVHTSRRFVLGGFAALTASTALTGRLWAQEAATPPVTPEAAAAPAVDPGTPFTFDLLTEEMKALALQPDTPAAKAGSFLEQLTYDDYKKIKFRDEAARWIADDSAFRIYPFHMGWLFEVPVHIYEVEANAARPMEFSTDDFEYIGDLAARVPQHGKLPGVAGFRLNAPLNRADLFDEVVAFLGASYFRALGRGNTFGLSARGLAINTALPRGEEFPRFSRFYLERPVPFAREVTVYAALESASCTGAYRFVVRPGAETTIEVTARLFFRNAVDEIGVAPLTSMFLFSEKNRASFDDYRPNVHDSEGLRIERRDGDVIWRPLNNPIRLTGSYFVEENPRSFGLMQRDRDFEAYQDASAHYEKRPSLVIEPLADWGKGSVRLVEIPTDLEGNDNIVAFWVPGTKVQPGEMREFAYRMRWGMMEPEWNDDLAFVHETRAGIGGVSGVENTDGSRKFVVDFGGGLLATLPDDAEVEAVVNISGGEVLAQTLSKIPGQPIWRLVIDLKGVKESVVEMGAHISGYGRKLTEKWLYQWIVA
ncbi:glucan biosynthesis protein [Rhodobacter ferrooxidans]|uniref:Periplasmic glucan biosynthesis protein MdoG n=1 Tax=Rhodobacter ferrooxidans TaxID=371731 RepID=C8S4L0_9RHOB|nr:glucan biosynthesis protein G [Rhodobacter sp. SW2]EEW24093.1 periplasmic glucan biosynthesis protein MdoG [Rhodobacter sp. SW2]